MKFCSIVDRKELPLTDVRHGDDNTSGKELSSVGGGNILTLIYFRQQRGRCLQAYRTRLKLIKTNAKQIAPIIKKVASIAMVCLLVGELLMHALG